MQIDLLYTLYKQCKSVSTDSRKIIKNSMFFALKGGNFDGNKFAVQALKNGCKYAIIDEVSLKNEINCIYVEDVLTTLQKLAKHHRNMLKIPLIAITGTNGKTTTKELTAAVLSKKFKIWFTKGNFNNHIGVPLTLLNMPHDTEIAIIEMGANHIGEIDFLCNIALPNFGLITNVGKAHLEGFGSFENIMKTKAELYRFIETKGKLCFINSENKYLINMLKSGKCVRYGTKDDGLVKGRNVSAKPLLEFEWKKNNNENWNHVKTKLIGDYNYENALAAVCIATYFNVAEEHINYALSEYIPENNRSQQITTSKNRILLDAYNANPSSMSVALSNFERIDAKNKVLIIGGMQELGIDSQKEHDTLLEQIKTMNFDFCFLVGNEFENYKFDNQKFNWFEDVKHLSDYLQKQTISDKFILLKGSRSNELEKILEFL